MEPFSVAASAITVATLAASTCRAFANLRALCKSLPGRLHALNNEVADIEVVLIQVATVFDERAYSITEKQQRAIPRLLDQANEKLTELQSTIEQLTKICASARVVVLQAHAWRREQPKLRALQEDIKTVKCNLNILLGASNSRDMLRIRLDLQNLSAITSEMTSQTAEGHEGLKNDVINSLAMHQDGMQTSLHQVYELVDQRIAKVEGMLKAQADQVRTGQASQFGPLYRAPPMNRKRSSREAIVKLQSQQRVRSEGVRVQLSQSASTCRLGCQCICHASSKSATPALIDRVLGKLFVGYAGLPLLSARCDNEECQKSQVPQISLEYWFPLGVFWSQIVRLQVGYQANIGPQVSLSTLRRIPDSAQCVTFALSGNIGGLKDLFARGLASPRDVSTTRGYSILRWALYGKQYETCKFLLHAGADADYRPISAYDNSPKNKAWDFILQGGLPREVVETLLCLTQGSDFIDEQNYTQTHRIVLGLSMMSLEEEIVKRPEDIDAVDALGRTPLIWAAARGNEHFVALLLGAGADPNILDRQWTGGVSYAAERDHTACVRLMLEAGAEPDPVLPAGVKVGSALNCAARNATDPLVIKTLLDFGADVESSGVECITSLIHVARANKASFATVLLEYGAAINATSTLGQTALTTAIAYNSHDVLQLLLDRWFEYSECPRLKGPHLLEMAAMYADVETINILTKTNHFMLKYDRNYAAGNFVTLLRERSAVTEKLVTAFESLLDVICEEPDLAVSTPSLMEAGLLSCPVSEKGGSDAGSDHNDSELSFADAPEQL